MPFEVYQAFTHCIHHRARGYRGAAELVEDPAIAAYPPLVGGWIAETAAIEIEDPVAAFGLDGIAQPRGFPVTEHPHTDQCAFGIDAHQQPDGTAVSIRCLRCHHQCHRFAIATRTIDLYGITAAEQGGILHLDDIAEQVVGVTVRW